MIICNGSPKTGTHMLARAVALFGEIPRREHIPFGKPIVGKHIHIVRNPRNVLISWVRFIGEVPSSSNIQKHMKEVIEEYFKFTPWLYSDAYNTRFEALLCDPKEIERISEYLGKPTVEEHFKKIWGVTATFTGKPSNWRDYWNNGIDKVWKRNGGNDLEDILGYKPEERFIRWPS